ncbi:hypothetical protein ABIE51_002983 [Lysobacter sp. OAE881]
MESPWIPAFAGMTSKSRSQSQSQSQNQSKSKSKSKSNGNGKGNIKMDSSFRWNDGEGGHRSRSARTLRAWIPAFAGMTLKWFTAVGVHRCDGLGPGLRRDDGEVGRRYKALSRSDAPPPIPAIATFRPE